MICFFLDKCLFRNFFFFYHFNSKNIIYWFIHHNIKCHVLMSSSSIFQFPTDKLSCMSIWSVQLYMHIHIIRHTNLYRCISIYLCMYIILCIWYLILFFISFHTIPLKYFCISLTSEHVSMFFCWGCSMLISTPVRLRCVLCRQSILLVVLLRCRRRPGLSNHWGVGLLDAGAPLNRRPAGCWFTQARGGSGHTISGWPRDGAMSWTPHGSNPRKVRLWFP